MRKIRMLFSLFAVALLINGCAAGGWMHQLANMPIPPVECYPTDNGARFETHYDASQILPTFWPNICAETYLRQQTQDRSWPMIHGQHIYSLGYDDPYVDGRWIHLKLITAGVVHSASFECDGIKYPVGTDNGWIANIPNTGDGGTHLLTVTLIYNNIGQPQRKFPMPPFFIEFER